MRSLTYLVSDHELPRKLYSFEVEVRKELRYLFKVNLLDRETKVFVEVVLEVLQPLYQLKDVLLSGLLAYEVFMESGLEVLKKI